MTDLTEQFSAYGRWRGQASDAVARLRAWLARNDVGNAALHWIALGLEEQIQAPDGGEDTFLLAQYYRYW